MFFFWYFDTFRTIPTEIKVARSAVPPWLIKGSGSPSIGASATIAAIFKNACIPMSVINPTTNNIPN